MANISLSQLLINRTVTNVSVLRYNKSGYPYVTLLCGSKSNNCYFGQETAELINNTFEEGERVDSFLAECDIVEVPAEIRKEARFKIIKQGMGNSDYTSSSELYKSFGINAADVKIDFPLEDFKKEFQVKTVTTATAKVE